MKKEEHKHLRFAVLASDVALFSVHNGKLLVRVMRVDRPPYFVKSQGLPGGLIDPKETAEDTVRRLLDKKAKVAPGKVYIEQLYTFSRIDRDPRGRVIAVAYLALVPWEKLSGAERESGGEAWWIDASAARNLAYDHDEILKVALARLRSRIAYTTLIQKLMPKEFTLTELETMYENLLKTQLDKRNFRKKILRLKIVVPTAGKRTGGRFRPAQLYRFASPEIKEIEVL